MACLLFILKLFYTVKSSAYFYKSYLTAKTLFTSGTFSFLISYVTCRLIGTGADPGIFVRGGGGQTLRKILISQKKNPDKKVCGVEQKGFPRITHSIGAIQEFVFLTTYRAFSVYFVGKTYRHY